jgi:glycosyltransferase involved in cell wall biosynthesis
MRVLCSHYLADENHPAVRIIQVIGQQLRSLGHEVAIHRSFGPAPRSASGAHSDGTGVAGLQAAIKGTLGCTQAMSRHRAMVRRDRAAVACFRPQVVLCRQDAYCWSMPLVCRRLGVPLVSYADAPLGHERHLFGRTTPRGGARPGHPPRLVEALERWGLKHSRAVVTVSCIAAKRLRRYKLGVPVRVIPSGVHPELFPQLPPDERQEKRRFLRLRAPLVIGFRGTFRPLPEIDCLRELMLKTSARTDVEWLLIGDGPGREVLRKEMAGKVRAVFLKAPPAEYLGRLLSLIDVAVVPPAHSAGDFDCLAPKILEFAAAGCAVIASDQGDIAKLLDHGRAGLLLSPSDQAHWQAALSRVLDDGPYRQLLGRAARRFVLSNFTWRHTARRLEQVLREVVPDQPPDFEPAESGRSNLERRLAVRMPGDSGG